jgi:hypothetical protein
VSPLMATHSLGKGVCPRLALSQSRACTLRSVEGSTPSERPAGGWLRALPEPSADGYSGYWLEGDLRRTGLSASTLAYVVLDEIIEGHVGLVVARWPRIDAEGRIRFEGPTARVGCGLDELNEHLARSRRLVPELHGATLDEEAVRTRPAAIGDVFGVSYPYIEAPPWYRILDASVTEWMRSPVDVTAAARDAAKVTLYGAVAGPPLTERELDRLRAEAAKMRSDDSSDEPERPPPAPLG